MSQLRVNRTSAALAPSNGSDSGAAADDPRVVEALEEYATALKQGRRPRRAEFLAKYADVAEALAECLDGLEMVHGAAAELASQAGEASALPADEALSGTLGDYRLVREIGRGGMGVVYEAEQISLGRRVALKVLPFAATMDKRQLQRFQNEARAAASLEHPHIVPVYGVGCERGVHYYAMRFIEGQPLDAILQQLRDEKQPAAPMPPSAPDPATGATVAHPHASATGVPVVPAPATRDSVARAQASTLLSQGKGKEHFRRIAQLALHAADALEHAHQTGIVHRDIKPANLLLDDDGELWITDFGLAQVRSDTRLTMTGDLVGTLRYMSPEQALAKRVIVDHRTDIYSLGATFYEVLTLTPVFGGQDRQELLRQIAFEEPAAPRRLNRSIPAELETVILKALEKNPTERYGTAKEIADDLKRFLNDEPTLARRPGMLMRARKWSRRHVAAVRAAAVAMFVVVAVVAGTAGWWLNDRANREAETERSVEAALEESFKWQRERRMPEALVAARRAAATLASGAATLALEKRVQERDADLKFVADLEAVRLQRPGLENIDSYEGSYLSKAYSQVFREFDIDVESLATAEAVERIKARTVAIELTAALDHWALVVNPSSKSFDKELWKRLLAVAREADPDPLRRKMRDALAEKNVVVLLRLAQEEELPAPTALALVGALSYENRETEALELLLKVQKREPDYFWINYMLGVRLFDMRTPQVDESIRYLTLAVALRRTSAAAHNKLGIALKANGRLHEALAEYGEAIRLQPDYYMAHNNRGALLCDSLSEYDAAIAAFEEAIRLKSDLPMHYSNLSVALSNKGELKEALAACEKAIDIDPKVAASHRALGNVFIAMGQHDKAIVAYKQSTVLNPHDSEAFFLLGKAFGATQQRDDAAVAFQKALELKPEYAQAHNNLGIVFGEMGRLEDALNCYRTAIHHNPKLWQPYTNLAGLSLKKGLVDQAIGELEIGLCLSTDLWNLHTKLGIIFLEEKKRADDAIRHFNKAIELKSDFAHAHFCLGNALAEKKDWDAAIDSFRLAIKHRRDYADAHSNLGRVWAQKGRWDAAVDAYLEATRLEPASTAYQLNLGISYAELGEQQYRQGLKEEALDSLKKATLANGKHLAAHLNLAILLGELNRFEEAIAAFRQALEVEPNAALIHNDLAWLLANAPDPKFRDPKNAVWHAKRAIELSRSAREFNNAAGGFWNTLGAAHYRNNEWKESTEALEKSMELRSGGDSFDFFFLAMAQWQLEDKVQARTWFQKGVHWMEEHQPKNAELLRFRAEAAKLLGIKEDKGKNNGEGRK